MELLLFGKKLSLMAHDISPTGIFLAYFSVWHFKILLMVPLNTDI